MFYREFPASEKTKGFVLNFWEFSVTGETSEPQTYEIFPDGCLNLVFYYNDRIRIGRKMFVPIALKSVAVEVSAGDVFFGARISPAAAREFLQSNPAEFTAQPLESLPPSAKNSIADFDRIFERRDFAIALALFENVLEAMFPVKPEIDLRMTQAVRLFLQSRGQIKISEAATEIGLSRSQFERAFRRASGLTPKQYARICRLRATAINLVEDSRLNWADRAVEIGFSDQSHLSHELTNMTGATPLSFAKRITDIEHGVIIK